MADFATNVPIICLESETFKTLVKELAKEIREDDMVPFVDEKEAMRLLPKRLFRNKEILEISIWTHSLNGRKYLYRGRSLIDFIEKRPETKSMLSRLLT